MHNKLHIKWFFYKKIFEYYMHALVLGMLLYGA